MPEFDDEELVRKLAVARDLLFTVLLSFWACMLQPATTSCVACS
jgi:hypothetical protein